MYHATTSRVVSFCQIRSGVLSPFRSAATFTFQPRTPLADSQSNPTRSRPCCPPRYHTDTWPVAWFCHTMSDVPSRLKSLRLVSGDTQEAVVNIGGGATFRICPDA